MAPPPAAMAVVYPLNLPLTSFPRKRGYSDPWSCFRWAEATVGGGQSPEAQGVLVLLPRPPVRTRACISHADGRVVRSSCLGLRESHLGMAQGSSSFQQHLGGGRDLAPLPP